jgi:hypothetical protein
MTRTLNYVGDGRMDGYTIYITSKGSMAKLNLQIPGRSAPRTHPLKLLRPRPVPSIQLWHSPNLCLCRRIVPKCTELTHRARCMPYHTLHSIQRTGGDLGRQILQATLPMADRLTKEVEVGPRPHECGPVRSPVVQSTKEEADLTDHLTESGECAVPDRHVGGEDMLQEK